MPRTARKISRTGFYHIIIRGVNDDVLDAAYIKEKISDTEARRLIEHIITTKQIPEISKESLIEVVDKIKKIKNMSKEQILRVLGVKKTMYYDNLNKK